jgi:16S rRNA (adenine1518-N6/adenine1519-N6)-dimethyltransferase
MDAGAARRIAAACDPASLPNALEVGAGTGALTRALLEAGARVRALEIDPELVAILREREDLAAAEVIQTDALAYDYARAYGDEPWCATGNLPYNVATPLLLQWIGLTSPPRRIVVMVQRDVADRFTARPGTAAYGSLTLAVGYAMSVKRAFVLGPESFYPRPKVDSAVVVMERHPVPPVTVADVPFMLQVVRAGFAYRRKTLANSLALALDIQRSRVQAALERLGIDTEIRGEQLDLDAYAALSDELGA